MATDPYGFADAAPSETDASRVLWTSVGALFCAAVGMCACYVPYFIGAPMGFYAAWNAQKLLQASKDQRDRSIGTVGLVAGLTGGAVCALWCMFILLYVLFFLAYFVFAIVLIGAGAANM